MGCFARTLVAISAMSDDALLDRYMALALHVSDLDQFDRLLVGLIKAEWNARHPEDPMPTIKERSHE
jgi:hypothetical protein